MEISLSCRCELDATCRRNRLWRLFGLVPKDRRQSRSATAFEDPDAIDLPPATVGKPAPLRSAGFPTAMSITPSVPDKSNIQAAPSADGAGYQPRHGQKDDHPQLFWQGPAGGPCRLHPRAGTLEDELPARPRRQRTAVVTGLGDCGKHNRSGLERRATHAGERAAHLVHHGPLPATVHPPPRGGAGVYASLCPPSYDQFLAGKDEEFRAAGLRETLSRRLEDRGRARRNVDKLAENERADRKSQQGAQLKKRAVLNDLLSSGTVDRQFH